MKKDITAICMFVIGLLLSGIGVGGAIECIMMHRAIVDHNCAHWVVDHRGNTKLIWNDDGSEVK